MRRNFLNFGMIAVATMLIPAALMGTPVSVNQVVFLQYQGANGPSLGPYATGEYRFDVFAATQGAGDILSPGSDLNYDIAVWCLTPFATTNGDKVPFAVGSADLIGQLHDVPGISEPEADSFYRDTTAMYSKFYSVANTSLHDDLQATIWERRDMIEGPNNVSSPNTFNFGDGNYQVTISGFDNMFQQLIGQQSGYIGNIYTPLDCAPTAVAAGDVIYQGFEYNYNHDKQEFGYNVPEPTSLLLLGTGLTGLALAALRRKKT